MPTEVAGFLQDYGREFLQWFLNFENQSATTILLKTVFVCLSILTVAIVREIILLGTLPETENTQPEDRSPVADLTFIEDEEEAPALITPNRSIHTEINTEIQPLPYQLEKETIQEDVFEITRQMPEFVEPSSYVHFISYDSKKRQSQLEAFDQLMFDLGEQTDGKRLVIADFEKKSSESGLLDVLEDRMSLSDITCREMWARTDLIPHAQMGYSVVFPSQKTTEFIKNLNAFYKNIIIFDRVESLSKWKAFFAIANIGVTSSERYIENTESPQEKPKGQFGSAAGRRVSEAAAGGALTAGNAAAVAGAVAGCAGAGTALAVGAVSAAGTAPG